MSTELGPLPPASFYLACPGELDHEGSDAYTADEMQAYAAAEVAKERKRCADAVRATPTHVWVDGSDQWGQPCQAKVATSREQYARACES